MTLRDGWAFDAPLSGSDSQIFNSADTTVEYRIDGQLMAGQEVVRQLDGIWSRGWWLELNSDVPATKQLEVRLYEDGVHTTTVMVWIGWGASTS
jgi:hypothetical protein